MGGVAKFGRLFDGLSRSYRRQGFDPINSTENKWMLRNLPSAAYNDIHDDDYYTADDIVQHRFEDTNRNW